MSGASAFLSRAAPKQSEWWTAALAALACCSLCLLVGGDTTCGGTEEPLSVTNRGENMQRERNGERPAKTKLAALPNIRTASQCVGADPGGDGMVYLQWSVFVSHFLLNTHAWRARWGISSVARLQHFPQMSTATPPRINMHIHTHTHMHFQSETTELSTQEKPMQFQKFPWKSSIW